jgi:hypothetical protein
MKRSFLIFALWLLAWPASAQANLPVRLALIAESADTAAASDVLTVELSRHSDVRLLERNEVERIYREQGLSAANQDYLKLGRMLGADGLLILQGSKVREPLRLSVRLVAVKPGVTLRQYEYPWPPDNPLQWAGVVVSQFQPFLSKLSVLPKDVLPISIVNLHSALASPQSEALEQELTDLLYARLINETDVFVLERRRLELLEDENPWSEAEENTFWSGSYLLGGVVDKAGYQKDSVTIEATLTPPDKRGLLSVAVSGARTNLPAVVDDLAAKILLALKKQTAATVWNPRIEADRYFEEAQWMLRWGMFQEAKSAGGVAWALGRQNRETAGLRIKAYQSYAGDPGTCLVIDAEKRVMFGQQINLHVMDLDQMANYASAPKPEQFADLVRAGELFQDAFRSYVESDPALDPAWLSMGQSLLDQISMWLSYYYFTADARLGEEDKIAEAKQLCLTIAGLLERHPGFESADTNHQLLMIRAKDETLWFDQPEQCLPLYRAIAGSGKWPLVRRRFFNAADTEVAPDSPRTSVFSGLNLFDPYQPKGSLEPATLATPALTGWTWAGRKRCPAVWGDFISELSNSSNSLTSLEGRILRCSYAWSDGDFEHHLGGLLDFVRQQRETLIAAGLAGQLLDDLHLLVTQRLPLLAETRRSRIRDQIWAPFETDFAAAKEAEVALREKRRRQPELEKKKDYLNSQTNFDFMSFAGILLNDTCPPEEARELLPLVTNYAARISQNQPTNDADRNATNRRRVEQQQTQFWIGTLEKQLAKALFPSQPNTNPPAVAAAKPVVPKPPALPTATNTPASAANSPPAPAVVTPLEIRRFWQIPPPPEIQTNDLGDGAHFLAYGDSMFAPHIAAGCYRLGKLWLAIRYDQFGYSGRADFLGIDLHTFTVEKVHFEGERFSLPDFTRRSGTHPFEVYGGYLYLSLGNSVRRYSFKDHAWEQFAVPAAGGITPVSLGHRLFFTTSSSILELAADGSFRTWASTRRRPAESLLDRLENLGSPHLFLTADQVFHARIGNDLYAFSSASNNWSYVAALPPMDNSRYYPFDDGFIGAALPGKEWVGMSSDMNAPESWFRQSPNPGIMISHWSELKRNRPTQWRFGISVLEPFFQNSNFWCLLNPPKFQTDAAGNLQCQPAPGGAPFFVRFARGQTQPLKIPLGFRTEGISLTSVGAGTLDNPMSPPWETKWILQWTPEGLVMILENMPGFWLIPPTDLESAVGAAAAGRQQQRAAQTVMHEQWQKELLAAFNRNHDGRFSPEEREAMIDDPRYLELELPIIDANTNGLLEASELGFFDVNTNGVLDPREQSAINLTLGLLADKLIADSTLDGSGRIDPANLPSELFPGMDYPGAAMKSRAWMSSNDPAQIRLGVIDLLRLHLNQGLQFRDQRAAPGFSPVTPGRTANDTDALFKSRVEEYWHFLRRQTNRPPPLGASPP